MDVEGSSSRSTRFELPMDIQLLERLCPLCVWLEMRLCPHCRDVTTAIFKITLHYQVCKNILIIMTSTLVVISTCCSALESSPNTTKTGTDVSLRRWLVHFLPMIQLQSHSPQELKQALQDVLHGCLSRAQTEHLLELVQYPPDTSADLQLFAALCCLAGRTFSLNLL